MIVSISWSETLHTEICSKENMLLHFSEAFRQVFGSLEGGFLIIKLLSIFTKTTDSVERRFPQLPPAISSCFCPRPKF